MDNKHIVAYSNNYIDRRGMLNNKGVQYLLNKYRDVMMNRENEYRRALKIMKCEKCSSYNGCNKCSDK